MDSLKMASPVKQPTFVTAENKENVVSDEVAVPVKGIPLMDEPVPEAEKPSTAEAIKEEESIEPILQENPQRFVLFPIKYHEVRVYIALFSRNQLTRQQTDLADVQEGRSQLLDCRRN